jgi:hypothetical protein
MRFLIFYTIFSLITDLTILIEYMVNKNYRECLQRSFTKNQMLFGFVFSGFMPVTNIMFFIFNIIDIPMYIFSKNYRKKIWIDKINKL